MTPTHIAYKGGTLDGVWRECMMCRNDDDTYWMQTITVVRWGDGPIITRYAMSGPAFEVIAACFKEMSENLEAYAI